MTIEKNKIYDSDFIKLLFSRLHNRSVDDSDADGLSKMLEPINLLAERASNGLNFDDEPADFLRIMNNDHSIYQIFLEKNYFSKLIS